jgi:glucose-fructose oxidoreductase
MKWKVRFMVAILTGGVAAGIGALGQHYNPARPVATPNEKPLAPTPGHSRLRVAIAGMVHGHVDGFLAGVAKRSDVEILGIAEPDRALFERYAEKYSWLDAKLYHADLEELLTTTHPEVVLAYTNTFEHRKVVEICARYTSAIGIAASARLNRLVVMMEKPLAVTAVDAQAIAEASSKANMTVLVNYETTWYRSNREVKRLVDSGAIGDIRKVVVHDGHRGPKEIAVGPEFLNWLTDPRLDGGGALYDFGCYGADLMTWLMNVDRPLSVTAVTQTIKPEIYPQVDDEATILLTYPKAQAIVQASWNWPFDRKDLEVYGQTGYVKTIKRDEMEVRLAGETEAKTVEAMVMAPPYDDPMNYLRAVVREGLKPEGLGSLEVNVLVAEILDAARESAKTGRTVRMK